MMNSEEYADWFGIPSNKENKYNEGQKSDKNKKHIISLKELINKKRKPENEAHLDNRNIEKEIKFKNNNNFERKKFEFYDKSEIDRYNENKIDDYNSTNNSLYKEEKNKTLIKFNGIKNKFNPNQNILKHSIYLRTYNDFNPELENKIFCWKIKILCNTKFIGVGLADKYVVIKNSFKFFSYQKSFYNGVFCLYTIYDTKINKKITYAWHPGNKSLNDEPINFPPFEEGMEITLKYLTNSSSLVFTLNNNENETNFFMKNVKTLGNKGRNILTPCIIFFYPNDTVQISKLI